MIAGLVMYGSLNLVGLGVLGGDGALICITMGSQREGQNGTERGVGVFDAQSLYMLTRLQAPILKHRVVPAFPYLLLALAQAWVLSR